MKLKNALGHIPRTIPVRIFVGCQTILNGKRNEIPENEFNLKMRPYMDCDVLATYVNNGSFVMSIQ